jgi:hypothetical protein
MVSKLRPLLFFAVVATWVEAHASDAYPVEIRRVLAACTTPACALCHTTPRGGAGTATRPFAITMQNAGLTGGSNLSSLRSALQTLEQAGTDTDGDGLADTAELRQGSDPSSASSATALCQTGADGGTPGGGGGGGGGGSGGGGSGEPDIPDSDLTPQTAQPPYYGCSSASAGLAASLLGLVAIVFWTRRRASRIWRR